MRGGDGPTNVTLKVVSSRGGLEFGPMGRQWKTAEGIEIPFRGLTPAGSRNNILVG